jgi:hypothetical protein
MLNWEKLSGKLKIEIVGEFECKMKCFTNIKLRVEKRDEINMKIGSKNTEINVIGQNKKKTTLQNLRNRRCY